MADPEILKYFTHDVLSDEKVVLTDKFVAGSRSEIRNLPSEKNQMYEIQPLNELPNTNISKNLTVYPILPETQDRFGRRLSTLPQSSDNAPRRTWPAPVSSLRILCMYDETRFRGR